MRCMSAAPSSASSCCGRAISCATRWASAAQRGLQQGAHHESPRCGGVRFARRSMSHFDEMTCLLYLEGQLERPRALELVAHAEGCAECRALLRALERESRLLAHALVEEDEAVPACLLAPPVSDNTPWAWIVSFGLAAAGAYTLWTGVVEPWRQELSRAGFGGDSLITLLFFRGVFWKGWGSMANMLEFLAMATLGLLALGLLRRSWRRWTTLTVLMSTMVAVLLLPAQTAAAEVAKHVQSYWLPPGQTVNSDLIVMAETARIDGTVEGDLISFSRSLTVSGTTVRKNVTAFSGHFELDPKSRVGGGMMLFAGEATLDGRTARDLLGFIGRTTLNGFVGGNVRLRGDKLSIGFTAEIAGKASYTGHHQPEVDPKAKLASPLEVKIEQRRPDYLTPRYYFHQALSWGAAFVFGLVLILLLPGFLGDVVRSSHRYGPAFGFGALALFATPILAVLACATIVGLAVGIGTLLAWIVAFYSAQVFVGAWLGETLMGATPGRGAAIGRLAIGLLLLKVAGALPYIGGWIKLAAVFLGMGALALAVYKRTHPRAELPSAAVPA